MSGPRPRRRRRRLYILLGAATVLLLAVGSGLWLLQSSWFIVSRIGPELERRLGADVSIGGASYEGGGKFRLTDLTVRSRRHRGPAAEVVRIGKASVIVDAAALARGSIVVRSVDLEQVLLRLSEDDRRSGAFSIMGLDPTWPEARDERSAPPTVRIDRGTIEVGVHDGADYAAVGRKRVRGELKPRSDAEGMFDFWLMETDRDGQALENGVTLGGTWDLQGNSLTSWAVGLELDQEAYDMCPAIVRLWWDEMDLEGRVSNAFLSWNERDLLSVDFTVENVALTLPVEVQEFWGRYHDRQARDLEERPRMRVTSGRIRLGSRSLTLDGLRGTIRSADADADVMGVPYHVTLDLPALPELDWSRRQEWLSEIFTTSPFVMKVELEPFSIMRDDRGRMPSVDLPHAVAGFLEKFAITDWQLDWCRFHVARGVPRAGTRPSLATRGEAAISRASGAFVGFPYLLDDIDAHIVFDNELADIEFTGRGAGGALVHVGASVCPPRRGAFVDVCIRTEDAPVDERLRNALRASHRTLFDALLHEPSAERLRAAGLLPARGAIDRALAGLAEDLALAGEGSQGLPERAVRRLAQIERMAAFATFGPQCAVDLDLSVAQAPGGDPVINGRMELRRGELLFDRFPYPLRLSEGAIDWHDRLIVLDPAPGRAGLTVATPGGGRGLVNGTFAIVHDGERMILAPDLEILVEDDEVSELLLAALPLSQAQRAAMVDPDRWPGRELSGAARLVRSLDLSGPLGYAGTIGLDRERGTLSYAIDVTIDGGEASLTRELVEADGSGALRWPRPWTFSAVHGAMTVSNDHIDLHELSGARGPCTATASGTLETAGPAPLAAFDVDFRNVPLDEDLFAVLGHNGERVRSLAARLQCDGSLAAGLTYRSQREPLFDLSVWPEELVLGDVQGRPVALKRSAGAIAVHRNSLDLEGLTIAVTSDQETHGVVRCDGRYRVDEAGRDDWAIDMQWTDGRLECPLVAEAVAALGEGAHTDLLRRHNAAGAFDASASYRSSPPANAPRYRIAIEPRTLALDREGHRLSFQVQSAAAGEGQGGAAGPARIVIEPGTVSLDDLRLVHGGGAGELSGLIRLNEGNVEAVLEVEHEGPLMDATVQALLPERARQALRAIAYTDGPVSRLRDGRLEYSTSPQRASLWCTLEAQGASLDAGMRLEDLHGSVDLDAALGGERPPRLEIAVHDASFLALGHRLERAHGRLSLSESGDLLMPDLRADLYGGAVASSARIATGGEHAGEYAIEVQVAGVAVDRFQTRARTEAIAEGTARPADGKVFASLSMGGERERPEDRYGRGHVRVLGGMGDVPLAMKIVQVAHLSWPMLQDLEYAESEFYIRGERLKFEGILFESIWGGAAPLQILGEGEMDLRTYELDTRFRSRGGWLVLRDVVGGLGDQIMGIRVSGPLSDPRAELVALPGLGRHDASATDTPPGAP